MPESQTCKHDYAIVADIGGTHARFSYVCLHDLSIEKIKVYPCSQFENVLEALLFYKKECDLQEVVNLALAIACPVHSDEVKMTNLAWSFLISELNQQLGLSELMVLNDFTAMAMSLPLLQSNELHQIGGGCAKPSKPKVVLGPGTGLGIATLVQTSQGYIALDGEGGHANWSAQTQQEWFIQRFLSERFGHVSFERLLSGSGIENIYLALAAYEGIKIKPLCAAEITNLALRGQSQLAIASIFQFLAILGSLAGDLALTLGALGGVYIAGGILPKLQPLVQDSSFRQCFEEKGRFTAFNQAIPTYMITAKQPGLLGAAVALKQHMEQ